jgi:hypothetical protein
MDDLDQSYIQTRQEMRAWQGRMLMEPVQQGTDVYMGAQEGGKPTDGQGVAPTATTPKHMVLPPQEEVAFQAWYSDISKQTGLNQNPDEPLHKYDFRAFYKSGQQPAPDPTDIDPETGKARIHFSSQFKDDDHPNRFVKVPEGILDSKNDKIITQQEFESSATPEQKQRFKQSSRQTFTVDTPEAQAVRQQYQEQFSKMASGETAVEAVGRGGKAIAEATRPGFVVAAKALGMDDNAAEAVGDAFVQFMGGLPGNEESDFRAGIETALAALPVVGAIAKTGEKGVAMLAANKDAIVSEFQKAVKLLKSERGSVPLGGAGGAGKPPEVPPVSIGGAPEPPMSAKQLATISKREEAKQAYGFAVEGFQEELTKQRRGPVLSDEAVRKLAEQSGFTLQDLLDLKPGSVLAPEIQVKAREVYKAAVDRMKTSAKAYLEQADGQAFDEFAEAFTQAGMATTRIIGTYSEAGRTFRLLNQKFPTMKKPGEQMARDPEFRIQDQYIQEMYKFFRGAEEKSKMGGFAGPGMSPGAPGAAISPGQLAQMVMDLPSEEAMMNFAKAAMKPTWSDMLYEVWVNGLLSGPITHSTNIISNAATLAWNIPERQIASLIKPGSVRPGEAAAMIGGVFESVGDAWRLAWKAFKEEAPQFGQTKLEMPKRAITADALELTGMPGRAIDFLANAVGKGDGKWLDSIGTGIRLPGRFLLAADDFFKAIAFRAELRALAKRQAFREVNELGLTGKEAAKRAKEIEGRILADPPGTIKEAAQEFAAYTTFTRELGPAGAAIQNAVQNVPMGRVVLPFIRTPANIFKFAGERTPLALASKAVREELAAGGERAALAQAKIALGAMTMGFMGMLAANGHITGGGPKDKKLLAEMKDTGWQPYSFKIGNEYISYGRIEPLGSLIGMAADAADLMGQLSEKDAAQLASALTVAISRNMANKTFVKGLAGTLNAVTSQDVNVVKSFLERELPTILPYSSALGQTAKTIDPVQRDVKNLIDAFKAKIPGYSTDLPARRNIFGEPFVLGGGLGPDLVSPLYTSTYKADRVRDELARLGNTGAVVAPPSPFIEGIDISKPPLGPKVYDRYQELAGGKPKGVGQTLHQELDQLMFGSNRWMYDKATDGKDEGKITLVKDKLNMYRDLAAVQLEEENKDLAAALQQQRMKKATKMDKDARQRVTAPTVR